MTSTGREFRIPPIFEYSSRTDGVHSWVLRPLMSYRSTPAAREFILLWPILRSTRKGAHERDWLLPIWSRRVRPHLDGTLDRDSIVLPFFWWGSDPSEGAYFLFFPVAGTMKGLFGQDRVDFFLFPLWARVRNENRDSRHVLWPFFNIMTGSAGRGWKVWPLAGHHRTWNQGGTLQSDRRFYLWPFFVRNDEDLDSAQPNRVRWYFPFYASAESPNITRRAWFWPLVQYKHDRDEEFRSFTLFPFIFSWGKERAQRDFWPIFGQRRTANDTRQFLLWPIQRYEFHESGDLRSESFWILPLAWLHRQSDLRNGTETMRFRFWPLYSRYREPDGSLDCALPDLFPFRDPERFDPLYSRLWQIFRYHEEPGGARSNWELLWGFLQGDRAPDGWGFSLLGGLLERKASAQGETRWKAFYVPF